MSFIRSVKFQPERLEVQASLSWTRAVLAVLKCHKHSFSDHLCLRFLRQQLGTGYLSKRIPRSLQQELFQKACDLVRGEHWSAVRDFQSPDMFVAFFYVYYCSFIEYLEIPCLVKLHDRLTVLEILETLHVAEVNIVTSLKLYMFDMPNISLEESQSFKKCVLTFRNLHTLSIWKACDDITMKVIGETCNVLQTLDIWKSSNTTDSGVRFLLGLDAERPNSLCSSLSSLAIKDTSITDNGAFQILIHCDRLTHLQFSKDTFLPQLLTRIVNNYLMNRTVFPLKNLFLQVNKSSVLPPLIKSLPQLEELSLWTSITNLNETLTSNLLPCLTNLKLGGLHYHSLLKDMVNVIGSQLTKLKIETFHFDIDINLIGRTCLVLKDLSVINGRIKVTRKNNTDSYSVFPCLKQVYFFLVQYSVEQITPRVNWGPAPGVPESPSTGYTALHFLLRWGFLLENIQVSGTSALTDSCLTDILSKNPLISLQRMLISHPLSLESRNLVVPLTLRSVTLIQNSCPNLNCLGDLKHWAVTPAQRRKLSRKL